MPRARKYSDAQIAAAVATRAQGLSYREIAARCGITVTAVQYLIELGSGSTKYAALRAVPRKKAVAPKAHPAVADSDWLKPPTLAQLMAGR